MKKGVKQHTKTPIIVLKESADFSPHKENQVVAELANKTLDPLFVPRQTTEGKSRKEKLQRRILNTRSVSLRKKSLNNIDGEHVIFHHKPILLINYIL
ncbi:hypothetical protein [Xenorhabdus stockiae]|uniref:hypothetical protein n=1 Tax=Xenorhabdus stockiae TaxID=351614 RepID=UPI001145292E|nr:hypothetical protein [Xenorhabdus stockiae]